MERRVAAILAADVVGFSCLIGVSEARARHNYQPWGQLRFAPQYVSVYGFICSPDRNGGHDVVVDGDDVGSPRAGRSLNGRI